MIYGNHTLKCNIFVSKLLQMKYLKFFLFAILIFPLSGNIQAQSGQLKLHFSDQVSRDVEFDYLLYLPDDFDAAREQTYPLMLFLHGSGERGDDLELVKKNGPPKMAEEMDLPFIILSPQCPEIIKWEVDKVKVLLDEIIASYPVDTTRVYITGLSMGGYGVWEMITDYPEVFAAAIPVCGFGYPFRLEGIKDMPVWVFHGALDNVIPIDYSLKMVAALKKLEAIVKFTIYPDADHDSWTETYSNPEVYEWLLMQKKSNNH